MSDDRIQSIINASTQHEDSFAETIDQIKAEGNVIACHQSCVSSYTSWHHID